MASCNSKIEWTESTWNPTTGCDKVSIGCKNCYAERMAVRLKAMGNKNYRNGFKLALHEDSLAVPLKWKKPRMIFVNSMSDLFHEDVSMSFILKVFKTINNAHWHTFQILTKRSERLIELNENLDWPQNVWLGVSVENEEYNYRIDYLRRINSIFKFISFEPLLGPVNSINLHHIDWVVVGGESGPGARIMKKEWVNDILDQCIENNVPFFFKQWGGVNKKRTGRILRGRTWDNFPVSFSK